MGALSVASMCSFFAMNACIIRNENNATIIEIATGMKQIDSDIVVASMVPAFMDPINFQRTSEAPIPELSEAMPIVSAIRYPAFIYGLF